VLVTDRFESSFAFSVSAQRILSMLNFNQCLSKSTLAFLWHNFVVDNQIIHEKRSFLQTICSIRLLSLGDLNSSGPTRASLSCRAHYSIADCFYLPMQIRPQLVNWVVDGAILCIRSDHVNAFAHRFIDRLVLILAWHCRLFQFLIGKIRGVVLCQHIAHFSHCSPLIMSSEWTPFSCRTVLLECNR